MPKQKVNLAEDILQIDLHAPVFEFYGLKAFRFQPSYICGGNAAEKKQNFDIYICGSFPDRPETKIELMSSFVKTGHRQYVRVKMLNIGRTELAQCYIVLNYFITKYLYKKCHLSILKTGLRASIP